jgi:isopentenyl phosphate kinase
MILIKLWWSIIAPKNKLGYIDKIYLQSFSKKLWTNNNILVHGTGNIWHWFIEKYGLSGKTYKVGREILDRYFNIIDSYLPWYTRERYTNSTDRRRIKQNTIIGGDITTDQKIISSDRIFAEILARKDISLAIIATDVDGVLDDNNNIIQDIDSSNIHTIHFWEKAGDVTWSMKEKIAQLIEHNAWSKKTVRICNGYNLDNIQHIIKTGQWVGTRVLL